MKLSRTIANVALFSLTVGCAVGACLVTSKVALVALAVFAAIGAITCIIKTFKAVFQKNEIQKNEIQKNEIQKIISESSCIINNFTEFHSLEKQKELHQSAKTFLKENLAKIGAKYSVVNPKNIIKCDLDSIDLSVNFENSSIFKMAYTNGVMGDIEQDGNRQEDNHIVYGVASQFNGCEAPVKMTIEPGKAVNVYKDDRTQGPQAQLAFSDEQVELINCGGNLGFNGLCNLLDEETKAEIAHGYFTPQQSKADQIINLLKSSGTNIEYPCVENKPKGGNKTVHQILVSAPALGIYAHKETEKELPLEQKNEIEFLMAFYSFQAQFQLCLDLALESKKPVILKATAVGLGVFGNKPENVAKAFYAAAQNYVDAFKENRVQVIFQVFKKDTYECPNGKEMVSLLGLKNIDN